MVITSTQVTCSRAAIADAILHRLDAAAVQDPRQQFARSPGIQWFSIDNLLPENMAKVIHVAFPTPSQMRERKTLREHKYVAAQMDRYHPQAEEALFAFHDSRVVARVAEITGLSGLLPDPKLYAGGISLMAPDNFLNPHLDNSHNNDRSLYRVLNLLYYVSPGWTVDSGGHLEVWPQGMGHPPQLIPSLFNRLVVMTTGPESWHSGHPCAERGAALLRLELLFLPGADRGPSLLSCHDVPGAPGAAIARPGTAPGQRTAASNSQVAAAGHHPDHASL